MEKIITGNVEDTIKTAKTYAKSLKSGDIVLLSGDLGAGKTVFSKGLVEALTGETDVVSPTFSIVNSYDAPIPVYHFDLYRIEDESELENIGVHEMMYSGGICIFEWAERAESLFPSSAKKVEIRKIDDKTREITL